MAAAASATGARATSGLVYNSEDVARYQEHSRHFFNLVEAGNVDGAVEALSLMPAWIRANFLQMNPYGAKVEMYVENLDDETRYAKVLNLAEALRRGEIISMDVIVFEMGVLLAIGNYAGADALFKQHPDIAEHAKGNRSVYWTLERRDGPRTTLMDLVVDYEPKAGAAADHKTNA